MQRRQSEDSSSLRDLINKRDKQAKGSIVISCSPCCFFRLCGREGSNVRFKFVWLCIQRATGFFVGTTRNIRSTETGYYLQERWSLFFADIAYLSRPVIFGVPESRHTFFFFFLVSVKVKGAFCPSLRGSTVQAEQDLHSPSRPSGTPAVKGTAVHRDLSLHRRAQKQGVPIDLHLWTYSWIL